MDGIPLDLLTLDPGQARNDRENAFLDDVREICERFNAEPMDGAFNIEGQKVSLSDG